jgi:predicted acylesterase/phospholipase RssA
MIIETEPANIIVNLVQRKHLKNLKSYSIVQAFHGKGLLKFERFQTILDEFIQDKFETPPTFRELYDLYPKKLYCVTFNYTKNKEEILSVDSHPDLLVTEALRMSSNVPFIFENYKHDGCYYYDGFLANNFPIHLLETKDKCLGITCFQSKWTSSDNEEPGAWKVFWNLFLLPLNKLQDIKNAAFINNCKIISIDLNRYSLFDFRLNHKMILDLFSEGYSATKDKFSISKDKVLTTKDASSNDQVLTCKDGSS